MFEGGPLQISGVLSVQLSPHWFCILWTLIAFVSPDSWLCLLHSERPPGSASVLSLNHILETLSRQWAGAIEGSLICFPSLWDHSLLRSEVQCPENYHFIYLISCFFLIKKHIKIFCFSRWNSKSNLVTPSYPKTRIIIINYVLPIFSRFCFFQTLLYFPSNLILMISLWGGLCQCFTNEPCIQLEVLSCLSLTVLKG